MGDAPVSIAAAKLARPCELGARAAVLALEGVSGCKIGVGKRVFRVGAARLLEPEDRRVNAGLRADG